MGWPAYSYLPCRAYAVPQTRPTDHQQGVYHGDIRCKSGNSIWVDVFKVKGGGGGVSRGDSQRYRPPAARSGGSWLWWAVEQFGVPEIPASFVAASGRGRAAAHMQYSSDDNALLSRMRDA